MLINAAARLTASNKTACENFMVSLGMQATIVKSFGFIAGPNMGTGTMSRKQAIANSKLIIEAFGEPSKKKVEGHTWHTWKAGEGAIHLVAPKVATCAWVIHLTKGDLTPVEIKNLLTKMLKRRYANINDSNLDDGDWVDRNQDIIYCDGEKIGVDLKGTPEPFRASVSEIGELIGNTAMADY